eukprot:3941680-Rhodomonas_salina.2
MRSHNKLPSGQFRARGALVHVDAGGAIALVARVAEAGEASTRVDACSRTLEFECPRTEREARRHG